EASLPQSEKPRWHDSRFHSPTSLISGSLVALFNTTTKFNSWQQLRFKRYNPAKISDRMGHK
ncbi:hypothetical protein, partial [Ralstonia solanacearum]|uniref:hypothetical protein n=1 Tax=Ralstonia solanacearum TaxID=305 RepID=UPI001F299BFB